MHLSVTDFRMPNDIYHCIEKVQKAWTDKGSFQFKNPDDICRFQKDQQDVFMEWLKN